MQAFALIIEVSIVFLRATDQHLAVVRNTFLCTCALHLSASNGNVTAEGAAARLGIQDTNELGCFATEPKLNGINSIPLPCFPCDLAQTTIPFFF